MLRVDAVIKLIHDWPKGRWCTCTCAVLVPEDLSAPGELAPDSFTYGIIFVMSIFMAGVVATSWPPWLRGEGQRAMVERIAKLAIAAPLSAAGLGMEAIAATSLSNLRNVA